MLTSVPYSGWLMLILGDKQSREYRRMASSGASKMAEESDSDKSDGESDSGIEEEQLVGTIFERSVADSSAKRQRIDAKQSGKKQRQLESKVKMYEAIEDAEEEKLPSLLAAITGRASAHAAAEKEVHEAPLAERLRQVTCRHCLLATRLVWCLRYRRRKRRNPKRNGSPAFAALEMPWKLRYRQPRMILALGSGRRLWKAQMARGWCLGWWRVMNVVLSTQKKALRWSAELKEGPGEKGVRRIKERGGKAEDELAARLTLCKLRYDPSHSQDGASSGRVNLQWSRIAQ